MEYIFSSFGRALLRSFGLSQLGLSRLILAYLLSHNTIYSTSRALFLESAEQKLIVVVGGQGSRGERQFPLPPPPKPWPPPAEGTRLENPVGHS
jgi:hypothetical protein